MNSLVYGTKALCNKRHLEYFDFMDTFFLSMLHVAMIVVFNAILNCDKMTVSKGDTGDKGDKMTNDVQCNGQR